MDTQTQRTPADLVERLRTFADAVEAVGREQQILDDEWNELYRETGLLRNVNTAHGELAAVASQLNWYARRLELETRQAEPAPTEQESRSKRAKRGATAKA